MSSWSPEMRQRTLLGPSARAYAALVVWLVVLLFACGGVMVVGMLVIDGGYGDHPVTAVAFGGVVLGVITSLVSFAMFTR